MKTLLLRSWRRGGGCWAWVAGCCGGTGRTRFRFAFRQPSSTSTDVRTGRPVSSVPPGAASGRRRYQAELARIEQRPGRSVWRTLTRVRDPPKG